MNLPSLSALQALWSPSGAFHGAGAAPGAGGLEPAVDVGCILGCVGGSAFKCMHCMADIGCWAACAGPDAVSCLGRCF